MTLFHRFALSLAVLLILGAVLVNGCGSGSGGGTQPPPEQQVTTPVIAPSTGTFTTAQSVSISDSTSGATIYYTIDGTTPTTASPVYSKAFTVSSTTAINAIATASGYTNSNVATATITITVPPPQAATPVIVPSTGTFTTAQSVTISDSTTNATIYYTLDGTTPTTASPVYSKAFTVSSTTTINAIAAATGYTNSNVATATITITAPPPQAATPVIAPSTGTFTTAQSVTISDSTSGATIYYTIDGTTPTTASPVYSKAFTVSSTTAINAIAAASGYTNSNVATSIITINVPKTISLPQTLSLPIGATPLVLDSSVVTATTSCDPASVTATVTVNDSNTSTTAGGILASWTADSSHRTYGSISSGNTFSQSGVNTYTVKLACGTATASSQLTVVDPAPTITAVSCSPSESTTACVVKSTGSFVTTITGTNFIAGNYTTLAQWPGTDTSSKFGKCPTVLPRESFGGDGWESFTEIFQGTSSNGASIGTWFQYVFNPPANATTYLNDPTDPGGTGGGWACLDNAYTVVANSSSSSSAGMVTLEPAGSTNPGTMYLRSTSTGRIIWQTSLDLGSTMAAVYGDKAFVPNKDAHSLSVIDLHNRTKQSVPTGDAMPWIAAVSLKSGTPYLVVETENGYNIEQYTGDGALIAMTSSGPQITDLLVDREDRLVYLVQHNRITEVHRLDPSNGREEIMDLDIPANSLSLYADGYFVYWTGEHHLTLIDEMNFRQSAQAVLQSTIYTANGEYFGLSDGGIWQVKAVDGQIRPTIAGQLDDAERYAGFVPGESNGQTVFYAVRADELGRLSGALAIHQSKAF
jgi:hypothetical protein